MTGPQTTHQVTLCYRHNSQPCSVVISPLLTPPAWVFRVVQTSFLPGIESLRWARTFISREILDAVVIQPYSSWRKGCQERLKCDSGPSKLPARIRGRLSLPASVSILKRKARTWDARCFSRPVAGSRGLLPLRHHSAGACRFYNCTAPAKTPLLLTACPLHTACSVPAANTLHSLDFQLPAFLGGVVWSTYVGAGSGGPGHFRLWLGLPPSVLGHSS